MSSISDWFLDLYKRENPLCDHDWDYRERLAVSIVDDIDYLTIGCKKVCLSCGETKLIRVDSSEDDRMIATFIISEYFFKSKKLEENKKNPPVEEFASYYELQDWIAQHEPS